MIESEIHPEVTMVEISELVNQALIEENMGKRGFIFNYHTLMMIQPDVTGCIDLVSPDGSKIVDNESWQI